MHSKPVLLETDRQSSTLNPSLVSISEQHHRFRFRNHTFLFSRFLFLHLPLRHGFTVLDWTDLAAGEHRTSHDVKQTEKMIPLITGEIASRQHVCEWVFGVNMFFFKVPVRKIFARNSSHDPPYHKTKRLFLRANFPNQVQRRFVVRTSFCMVFFPSWP